MENLAPSNVPGKRLRIMLVEDDDNDVELLRRAFRSSPNLQLEVAYHGREALEQITTRASSDCWPDLILCDLNMPVMNGIDFLRWLKRESPCPRTPLVVLTSSVLESDVENAYALGAAAYLVKPSSHSDLQVLAKTLVDFWKLVHTVPLRREK